jgi:hypothetical protein
LKNTKLIVVRKRYVLCVLYALYVLYDTVDVFAQTYEPAKISEKTLYTFDIARPIQHFDALADGSDWFAVDQFALLQTIIIRGKRFERRFNEIPVSTARFSPNGDYLIWMGLDRSYDEQGYNTTRTTVYEATKKSAIHDSVFSVVSDNNELYFSPSGRHWAATMPASKYSQTGLRDVVLEDGLIVAKDNPKPSQFSFSENEQFWAYRSTDGPDESLVTNAAVQKLYTRKVRNPILPSPDPVVYHFSPDLRSRPFFFESRDYDYGFSHQAVLFKTSYQPTASDTVHSYIIFNNKREPNFRWIGSIQIDTGGDHIAYFACDTTGEKLTKYRNEKIGVLVEDGKIIAGPYEETGRVFLSPSGKNLAWTAKTGGEVWLYLNGKKIGIVGDYTDMIWTQDEKKFAYMTADEKRKLFVVSDGKRSPSFDRIGRIGWTKNNAAVEFCAVKYDKLVHITQSF